MDNTIPHDSNLFKLYISLKDEYGMDDVGLMVDTLKESSSLVLSMLEGKYKTVYKVTERENDRLTVHSTREGIETVFLVCCDLPTVDSAFKGLVKGFIKRGEIKPLKGDCDIDNLYTRLKEVPKIYSISLVHKGSYLEDHLTFSWGIAGKTRQYRIVRDFKEKGKFRFFFTDESGSIKQCIGTGLTDEQIFNYFYSEKLTVRSMKVENKDLDKNKFSINELFCVLFCTVFCTVFLTLFVVSGDKDVVTDQLRDLNQRYQLQRETVQGLRITNDNNLEVLEQRTKENKSLIVSNKYLKTQLVQATTAKSDKYEEEIFDLRTKAKFTKMMINNLQEFVK